MIQITLTETRLSKNPNTKTTYIVDEVKTEIITEKQYNLTTCEDTVKWFRRLGGSESLQRAYTCAGYKVYKLTSKSPDNQTKVIREFKFKDIPLPANYGFENLSLYGKYNNLVSRGLMNDEVKQDFKDYETTESNKKQLETKLNNLNK